MYPFFAYLDRLKLIHRWGLMRNTDPENDMEHSMQTAMIAHGLAVLGNRRFGRNVNPERVALLALYHDASEAITGDLPTPIKYKNPEMQDAYRQIEATARDQLLDMLPEDLRPDFYPYIQSDETSFEWKLVKAADRISSYVKCIVEEKLGNLEFAQAKATIEESLDQNALPEVKAFRDEFIGCFGLSLDDLSKI